MPPSPRILKNLPNAMMGPYNTNLNQGYESVNHVSPIVPASYVARWGPDVVGLQFVGDSTPDLKEDHFQIQIQGGPYDGALLTPDVYRAGFVGYRLPRPLTRGTYQVTFHVTGFDIAAQTWTIAVRSRGVATRPYESAATRLMLESLNTARSVLHLSSVTWSARLQRASIAHASYLARNGYSAPSFHMESAGRIGYTGKTPWGRDMSFGWPTPVAGEVGIEWSDPSDAESVIQDLIDTVYHRLSLLSDNLVAAGSGQESGRNGSVVMDLGFGYRSTLPQAVVYPYDGQPGVPTSWVDIESPDPVKNGDGLSFGYPITADFPTVDALHKVQVRLTRGIVPVPAILDAPGSKNMADNQLGLVPQKALMPNTLYTVTVSARALFNNGATRPIKLSWSFATGGGRQSVGVAVTSRHRAVISVAIAGSGAPVAGQSVTLYRRAAGGPLRQVASGATNADGLWVVNRPEGRQGYYEAVTGTGNAAVFWWGSHD